MNAKNQTKLLDKMLSEAERSNAILQAITEEMIQLVAKYNLGRNLSDLELNRVIYALDKPEYVLLRNEFLAEVINCVIDDSRGKWHLEDREYEELIKVSS